MLLNGYPERKKELELEISGLTDKLKWLISAAGRAPADIERQESELGRLRNLKRDMSLGSGTLTRGSRTRLEGKKVRLQKLMEKSARLMKELAEMGVEIEDLRPDPGN